MQSVLALVLVATATAAQAPPPAPGATTIASAFACSRATLIEQQQCTIEGTTAAQAASRDLAKEHQRAAKAFAEDVCRSLARHDDIDDDAGLLAVCNARAAVAVKRCGGDGSRRLLDEAGRFNPGHARCYGALAAMVTEVAALADTASACCACVAERCGGSAAQSSAEASAARCVEKIGAGKPLEGTCASSTCSAACAALRLVAPRKP